MSAYAAPMSGSTPSSPVTNRSPTLSSAAHAERNRCGEHRQATSPQTIHDLPPDPGPRLELGHHDPQQSSRHNPLCPEVLEPVDERDERPGPPLGGVDWDDNVSCGDEAGHVER